LKIRGNINNQNLYTENNCDGVFQLFAMIYG
jgi:hypothetical protein